MVDVTHLMLYASIKYWAKKNSLGFAAKRVEQNLSEEELL
jgi:hypothetical protein